jgi:cell division protein FtsQ
MTVTTSPPAVSRMDPRIRQRRVDVRRQEGRRRLKALIVLLAVTVLAGAGWAAARSPLLDVDHIEFEGAVRTPLEEVAAATGLRLGAAMVDVDERAVAAGVESLPWVRTAVVHREWPGTLVIRVDERDARAAVPRDGDRWALIDGNGRVLADVEVQPEGLVRIEGLEALPAPGGTVPDAASALAVAAALTPEMAGRTEAVAVVESGHVELKLNPRGTVRLGPAQDLGAKLRSTETVLSSVGIEDLAVLDVRLPSSPVLTRG